MNTPNDFDSTNVEKSTHLEPIFETNPVRPCPSCGHCPTCGRGPGITYYGPWWGYQPPTYVIPCTTTIGAETVKFGMIS